MRLYVPDIELDTCACSEQVEQVKLCIGFGPIKKKKVKKYHSGFLDTNTFIMEEDGHLLVIDLADHAAVLERCRDATSVTVLLSHEHFDHISGLNQIRDVCASSFVVIASETCSERMQDTKANLSAYADVLAELGGKQIPEHWSPFVCKATVQRILRLIISMRSAGWGMRWSCFLCPAILPEAAALCWMTCCLLAIRCWRIT